MSQSDSAREFIRHGYFELSLKYAEIYRDKPRVFISCFLTCKSIRMVCESIVAEYKVTGDFKECQATGKDFSDYANKQNLENRWKRVLAETLLIIYSITR